MRVVIAAEIHGSMISMPTRLSTAKEAFEPDQSRPTYLLEAALPVVQKIQAEPYRLPAVISWEIKLH